MLTVKGKLITHKTGKYFSFSYRQRNQNSAINTYPTTAFDIFTTSYKLFFEQDDIDKNRIALKHQTNGIKLPYKQKACIRRLNNSSLTRKKKLNGDEDLDETEGGFPRIDPALDVVSA